MNYWSIVYVKRRISIHATRSCILTNLEKLTRSVAREAWYHNNKMMAKTPVIKDIQGESTIIPTLVTTPPHIPEKASHSVLATFTLSPDILTLTDWRCEVDISFYRPRCLCNWYTLKYCQRCTSWEMGQHQYSIPETPTEGRDPMSRLLPNPHGGTAWCRLLMRR